MTFGEWMDSLESLGYVSSRYYRGAHAGWDAAIAQRDKLAEDVRDFRLGVLCLYRNFHKKDATVEGVCDDLAEHLDAILAAHASPADADKGGGDHYDKEGNTFETG